MYSQKQPMKQKELDKLYEAVMKEMDKTLGDLKKMLEKQKIAEEQDRLRKIQVVTHIYRMTSW